MERIKPHILVMGDPLTANKWIGVAKKFARDTFQAKIVFKVWKVTGSITIQVQNSFVAPFSKVWIIATTIGDYQFYCTSPIVRQVQYGENVYCPGGSGVYVRNKHPIAYGSLIQEPDAGQWKYSAMPVALEGEGGLQEAINATLFPVKGVWQLQGLPEHVYYSTAGNSRPRIRRRLITAWTQTDGNISFSGAKTPRPLPKHYDHGYDILPGVVKKGTVNTQGPDMDWPDRACLQVVSSVDYGDRIFIIQNTADNNWTCWPLMPSDLLDSDLAEGSIYTDQSYKANVPPQYAKTVSNPYPDWVYHPEGQKRDLYKARGDVDPLDPRYNWSFNSSGTKAACCLLERTAPALTWKYIYNQIWDSETPPTEVSTSEPVQIKAEPSPLSPETESIKIDRIGLVELNLIIEITGPDLEDFSFSITVARNEPPSDEAPLRFAVAYAMPLDWSKTPMAGKVETDDLIDARVYLYRHTDDDLFIKANNGEYGYERPCKGKTVITNNGVSLLEFVNTDLYQRTYGSIREAYELDGYESFYAKFYNLDLASISFYIENIHRETVIADTPVSSRTYNNYLEEARIKSTTVSKVYRVYVFGGVKDEIAIGNNVAAVKAKADSPIELREADLLMRPGYTEKLRGMFDTTSPPWWFTGACKEAVIRQFLRCIYDEFAYDLSTQPGYVLRIPKLTTITEGSFYADFMALVLSQTYVGPPYPLSETPLDHPGLTPFSAANSEFSTQMWQDAVFILWKAFSTARNLVLTYINSVAAPDKWNYDKSAGAFIIGLYETIGVTTSNFTALDFDWMSSIPDHGFVSITNAPFIDNYPFGNYYYMVYSGVETLGNSAKIITTPEGHYSYYSTLPQTISSAFVSERVWLTQDLQIPTAYDTSIGTYFTEITEAAATFDKVGWDFGRTEFRHLDLYNKAFAHTDLPTDYEPATTLYLMGDDEIYMERNEIVIPIQWFANNFTQKVHSVAAGLTENYYKARPSARLSPLFF